MTEKLWQQRKHFNDINSKNENEIMKRSYNDLKERKGPIHFKSAYIECLKGSLDIKAWTKSKDLSVEDMGMLACRDIGCELTYCQQSLGDPYEKPFADCNSQFSQFNKCIQNEIRMFNYAPKGTIQEHLQIVLDMKKKNKYSYIFENENIEKLKEPFIEKDLKNNQYNQLNKTYEMKN